MNTIDGEEITDETIKALINREYMFYFKREDIPDIYATDSRFTLPVFNNLNKHFNVSFS